MYYPELQRIAKALIVYYPELHRIAKALEELAREARTANMIRVFQDVHLQPKGEDLSRLRIKITGRTSA